MGDFKNILKSNKLKLLKLESNQIVTITSNNSMHKNSAYKSPKLKDCYGNIFYEVSDQN